MAELEPTPEQLSSPRGAPLTAASRRVVDFEVILGVSRRV